jgi:hypothetical protein
VPVADRCLEPRTEEFAAMCAIDAARSAVEAGDADAASRACDAVPRGRWHDECWFRVAETQAHTARADRAFAACRRATAFSRMCVGHVAWLQSETLVTADPSDGDTAARVEALVGSLRPFPAAGGGDGER